MDTGTVAAFLAVDLLLVCMPGADWAYAITAGLRDRSVLPAVSGLVAGYAGHTLLAAAGLVVLVTQLPSLLTVLTVVGAVYLLWLGWSVLRQPADQGVAGGDRAAGPAPTPGRAALQGIGISGLNPKGIMLYLSLLPQFVNPGAHFPVAAQTGLFGVVHLANCAVVYLLVALLARTVLRARPTAARAVTRFSGFMMLAIGAFLLVEAWLTR